MTGQEALRMATQWPARLRNSHGMVLKVVAVPAFEKGWPDIIKFEGKHYTLDQSYWKRNSGPEYSADYTIAETVYEYGNDNAYRMVKP